MAKFAILIYEDPAFYASISPEAWPAVVDAHNKFVEQVFALGGSLAGGEALAPPTAGSAIRGAGTVTDGPFLETKEALNGFYVVEARDLDHAVEIAKLCPTPAPGGGVGMKGDIVANIWPMPLSRRWRTRSLTSHCRRRASGSSLAERPDP